MERVQAIRERLQSAIAPGSIEITDESHLHAGHPGAAGGGGHFVVTVVSERFDGLSTLQRHRLIYEALSDMMPAHIHALSITAKTPDEI